MNTVIGLEALFILNTALFDLFWMRCGALGTQNASSLCETLRLNRAAHLSHPRRNPTANPRFTAGRAIIASYQRCTFGKSVRST